MKKLWVYMRGYKRDCVLSPLFKLLEALLELMIPLIVKDIIDNGVGQRVYPAAMRPYGTARCDRSCVFDNGAVFLGSRIGRICQPRAS